jgi:hypothetical protein
MLDLSRGTWSLKLGPIAYYEMSIKSYPPLLYNIPEELRSYFARMSEVHNELLHSASLVFKKLEL